MTRDFKGGFGLHGKYNMRLLHILPHTMQLYLQLNTTYSRRMSISQRKPSKLLLQELQHLPTARTAACHHHHVWVKRQRQMNLEHQV